MNQGALLLVTSSIFALIALLHALRLLYGWSVTIGEWAVPVWGQCARLSPSGISCLSRVHLEDQTGMTSKPIALLLALVLAAPLDAREMIPIVEAAPLGLRR